MPLSSCPETRIRIIDAKALPMKTPCRPIGECRVQPEETNEIRLVRDALPQRW